MKNINRFAITIFLLGMFVFPKQSLVQAKTAGSSAQIRADQTISEEIIDSRHLVLTSYLRAKDSPLTDYSWEFIMAADKYQLDWRLIPAIVGLESYFGHRMVPGTHNAYGWAGGYCQFSSWEESIDHVASKLRENYYNRGLVNPELIGTIYAPPNPKWGKLVLSIMNEVSPKI